MSDNRNPRSRTDAVVAGVAAAAACVLGCGATLLFGAAGGIAAILPAGLLAFLLVPALGRKPAVPDAAPPPAPEEAPLPPEVMPEIPADRVDALTGLANANGLAAWFAENASDLERERKSIYVLLADLQGVADLERQRGREAAEAVIIEIAQRVSAFTGNRGIAARTGGNEFVAVAAVAPAGAAEVAEEQAGNLAETITRPVEFRGQTLWIAGSVGAAIGGPREGQRTLERAREALAKATELGPGRYIVSL